MDDAKKKNCTIAATLGYCWGFMIWWWLIGYGGLIVSLLVGAIIGYAAYAATKFLT